MSNLSKFFVNVASGNVTTFLNAYGPSATDRSNAYDSKIVFLGGTGQIFTQGQLFGVDSTAYAALKAIVDKLDGEATVEGSVKAQIAAVVGTAPEAFDTLQEIAAWLTNANNKDAAAIIEDVAANTAAIGVKGKAAVTAVEGAIWTEGSMYKKVGEEYVEVTDASTLVAGETYYTSDDAETNPTYTPIPTSRIAPATANIIGNGEDADTGEWYDYRIPVAGSDAVESTGIYKLLDEIQSASDTHTKTTVADGTEAGKLKIDGVDVAITAFDAAGSSAAVLGTDADVAGTKTVYGVAADVVALQGEIEGWDMWETYTPAVTE